MRIVGLKTLAKSSRWLRSRFIDRKALILGYHRVCDCPWDEDAYHLHVTPRHFSEHLEVLRKQTNPLSLQDLATALGEGSVPPRAVVITFDDGYVDNLHNAKPLLTHYDLPATIFVATGYIGKRFWWDEVLSFSQPRESLPDAIHLNINARTFEYKLRPPIDAKLRKRLHAALYNFFRLLPAEDREQGIAQLLNHDPIRGNDDRDSRALTSAELIELANGGMVDIGAHTVTHPFLAALTASDQRSEIQDSKDHLENILGRPVLTFSFPNGSLSEETPAIVRNSGFLCACGSSSDIVWRGSDRFHLPRLWAPDCDGEEFARRLTNWIGA